MAEIIKICKTEDDVRKQENINDKVKPILSKKLKERRKEIDRVLQKFIDHADSLDW